MDTCFADWAGTGIQNDGEKYKDVEVSNPLRAVNEFLISNKRFSKIQPPFDLGPSNFPDGWLYCTE